MGVERDVSHAQARWTCTRVSAASAGTIVDDRIKWTQVEGFRCDVLPVKPRYDELVRAIAVVRQQSWQELLMFDVICEGLHGNAVQRPMDYHPEDMGYLSSLRWNTSKNPTMKRNSGITIVILYPPITYYWTVPLILVHSYLLGKLTSSKIADTKVSGF